MITTENYFTTINSIDLTKAPEAIRNGHDLFSRATKEGTNMQAFKTNPTISRVVDTYIEKLNTWNESQQKPKEEEKKDTEKKEKISQTAIEPKQEKTPKIKAKGEPKQKAVKKQKALYEVDNYLKYYDDDFPISERIKSINYTTSGEPVYTVDNNKIARLYNQSDIEEMIADGSMWYNSFPADKIEKIPSSVAFINRYRKMNGKLMAKTASKGPSVLSLLNGLQKAIQEKNIRKTDKYATEINTIQKELVKVFNDWTGNGKKKIEIKGYDHYLEITNSYAIKSITALAKRFIAIQGKPDKKTEANALHKAIEKNIQAGTVTGAEIAQMLSAIENYLTDNTDVIKVSEQTLSGLAGIAGYKWKPNATQRKAFAERMKDPEEQAAYNARILAREDKNRSGSKFDYETAGGKYIPTRVQYDFALFNHDLFKTFDEQVAANQVISGYTNNEKVHHDDIHIVNEMMRSHPGLTGHKYTSRNGKALKKARAGSDSPAKSVPVIKNAHVIASTSLAEMEFEKAGYTGKWNKLIGDPVEPYHMMIWSKPGKGKSSLAIELAHYLASNHSKHILYISKDEGNQSYTMQEKFERLHAFHPNIHISDGVIPENLNDYNYVIFDLMNDFNFSYEDFKFKYLQNPKFSKVCFISIFKSTVDGQYRGDKDWENMFDVSININDEGYAQAQKNRFGTFGVLKFLEGVTERVYKFTLLQDAEKFKTRKMKDKERLEIVEGNDTKFWAVSHEYAQVLKEQGFSILS